MSNNTASDGSLTDFVPDFPALVPQLRPLPAKHEPSVPQYPGKLEGKTFVRRTEVSDPSATRAVYVHGMGGNSNNWIDLMYLLEPTFPGIALDLPGYGFSEPTVDGKYSVDRFSKAVIDVIEAEGGEPVHLFGNSLGGLTSVVVAAKRPDLVKSLTLIAPAMMTRPLMAREHLPKAWTILTANRKAKKLGAEELARQRATEVMALCYSDPTRLAADRFNDTVTEAARRIRLPYNQDIAAASARTLFDAAALRKGKSIWRLAESVQTPTLVVYGTEDKLVPVRLAPRAAKAFPNGQVTILTDCGHVAQMEFPEKTAELVLQWMASLAEGAQ